MKKNLLLFLVLFVWASSLFAQTPREVSGIVMDTTGTGVFGATIKLFPISGPGDTLMIRSNIDGIFVLKNVKISQFTLSITSLGYNAFNGKFQYTDGPDRIVLDKITLKQGSNMLDVVTINGAPPVTLKVDTVEYRAADFNMKENAVAEDLLKRIDGVEVDKDGNVTAKGKSVTKFKINGKEQFGGDLKTATKNIPVDMIDKLQIVDDYGDQAAFTGVKDGDPETIINITTRPGRNNGVIANGTAGGGSDNLYQFSTFVNQFKEDKSYGLTANINNNNTQGGGGGVGGRAGGGGGGGFQGGGGANGGLSEVASVGLNYGDKWGSKIQVNGGYFFNYSDNNNIRSSISQNANSLGIINSTGDNNDQTNKVNNSMNAKIQYNINKSNLLIITPSFGFTTTKENKLGSTFQTGALKQDQTTGNISKQTSPNVSANIVFNHLFAKARRNYSLNLNLSNSAPVSTADNGNHIIYYDTTTGSLLKDSLNDRYNETNNQNFSAKSRFIYTEPLNLTSRLQFSYNVNYSDYDNSRITSATNTSGVLQPIDSLSNIYQYSFTSHQIGLNYNYKNQNNELSLGLTANPTILSGTSTTLNTTINRSNFFLAPILRYTYRYSRTRSMQVNYFGNAREPQFAQLQPVRNVENPQRPVVGNPNLNSSFTHTLNADYNTQNLIKHTSFLVRVQGNMVSNSIVQNVVLIPDVFGSYKQEVRYTNANGNFSYGGNYNWQKSFKDRQYTIRLGGNASYNNQVSFLENVKNYSKTFGFTQRISLQIFPGNWLEFTPGFSYTNTITNYTLEKNTDTRIQQYSFEGNGRIFFLKSRSLILGFDGSKSFNNGYSNNGLNTSPLIMNSYLEKQFLKNKAASLKFTANDVFNQSNNISQTVTATGFSDNRTNRLTQYFMLTATMRLNRFGGVNTTTAPGQRGQGGVRGGGDRGGQQGGGYGGGQGGGGFGGGGGGFGGGR